MNPFVLTLPCPKSFPHPFPRALYKCGVSLCALFAVLAVLGSRAAYATTYTVTDLSDNASDSGSLRYAVNTAISGSDTIVFANNVIGTIVLNNGTLTINQSVTITGPGAGLLTISGNNAVPVFAVNSGTVSISGLSIANGSGAGSSLGGGAIFNNGTLTLNGCDISNNTGTNNGGAIYNLNILTVDNSVLFGNTTIDGGGGITNGGGTLTVENSTFFGNTSAAGGGLFNNGGTATVENSTFFGNNSGSGPGGGIFNNGTMTVNNSTITGNTGGGIFNNGGGSTITVTNSIVAGNTPSGYDCGQCGTQSTNNMIGGTPALGPLQYNGGTTETMMPLPGGSGIIGAGLNSGLSSDQRGFGRPASGASDLGAVQTNYLTVTTVNDSTDTTTCIGGATCSLRDAFNLAVSRGSADIVFQSGLTGTITLGSALPSVAGTLNISGPGAKQLSVSGANQFGIFVVNSGAYLAITGLTMMDGYNPGYGSGAIADLGLLTVENSAFSGTSAAGIGSGGGINNDGGVAVVLASTFSGNSGGSDGGAIFNDGSAVVIDTTFSGNTALEGGAIYSEAPLLLSSSTIDGNTASNAGYGGGIYDASAGSTLVVSNTVIAGNTSGSSPGAPDDCANCGTQGPSNMIGGAPNLGALAYNGLNANVQTMLPLPASPAIQAGDPTQLPGGLTTDERGFPRLTGAKLDVGAAQTNYTAVQFVQQPTDTLINVDISPAVTLDVLETNTNLSAPNNTDPVDGIPITLTFSGTGTLGGTLTQSTSGGVASFGDLNVNSAGTGDTLATSITVTPPSINPAQTLAATSNAFDITLPIPTVSFNPPLPASVAYGVAPLTLKATVVNSSGTPTGQTVSFQVDSGPATVSGNVLTITGAGTVVVEVDAVPDGSYGAADATASIVVNQASLTVTAANATRVYGTANPAFTGAVIGGVNGDVFSETFSTAAIQTSNAGSYAIVPAATGANLADYTVSIVPGTLTITKASSNLTLTASATQITPGTAVTLTATATSATTGTPTGTVTFTSGSTPLGTATLNSQGVATLAVTTLPVGSNIITASYTGDGNFKGSQAQLNGTIVVGTPSFNMTVNPTGLTIQRGQAGVATITLTPVLGYTGTVSFSCSGLPRNSACHFQPQSATLNGSGNPVQVTLAIQIGSPAQSRSGSVAWLRPAQPLHSLPVLPAMFFWLPGAGPTLEEEERKENTPTKQKSKSSRMLWMIALLVLGAALLGIVGCAGLAPNNPPAGQQTVTVIALGSGGINQSAGVQVTIQ